MRMRSLQPPSPRRRSQAIESSGPGDCHDQPIPVGSVMSKPLDRSVFEAGFTVPVKAHRAFQQALGRPLERGQTLPIVLWWDGTDYWAMAIFENARESNREIMQIRYNTNSSLKQRLASEFRNYRERVFTDAALRRSAGEERPRTRTHDAPTVRVQASNRPGHLVLSFSQPKYPGAQTECRSSLPHPTEPQGVGVSPPASTPISSESLAGNTTRTPPSHAREYDPPDGWNEISHEDRELVQSIVNRLLRTSSEG